MTLECLVCGERDSIYLVERVERIFSVLASDIDGNNPRLEYLEQEVHLDEPAESWYECAHCGKRMGRDENDLMDNINKGELLRTI